jgi:hypothetical protein
MDPIDLAQARESYLREKALRDHQAWAEKTKPALKAGLCNNCDEPVEAGARFCGPECRDDWQRRIDAVLRSQGGVTRPAVDED